MLGVLEFLYSGLLTPCPDLEPMELIVLANRLCLPRLVALTGTKSAAFWNEMVCSEYWADHQHLVRVQSSMPLTSSSSWRSKGATSTDRCWLTSTSHRSVPTLTLNMITGKFWRSYLEIFHTSTLVLESDFWFVNYIIIFFGQFHNAKQLSAWCLHHICTNYNSICRKFPKDMKAMSSGTTSCVGILFLLYGQIHSFICARRSCLVWQRLMRLLLCKNRKYFLNLLMLTLLEILIKYLWWLAFLLW